MQRAANRAFSDLSHVARRTITAYDKDYEIYFDGGKQLETLTRAFDNSVYDSVGGGFYQRGTVTRTVEPARIRLHRVTRKNKAAIERHAVRDAFNY